MSPGTKKTISTSKTTGRRFFLVRTTTRPNGRRYYVCGKAECKSRVLREADLYCRAHSQEQHDGNENAMETSMKSDEETSTTARTTAETESSLTEFHVENGHHDSTHHDNDVTEDPMNDSLPLSSNSPSNRQVEVDKTSGIRSYRDHTGRRRYLCSEVSCSNLLKRQSDLFCRIHSSIDNSEETNGRHTSKRSLTPLATKTNPYRSPNTTTTNIMATTSDEPSTNGNHVEKQIAGAAKKVKDPSQPRTGTHRSFRDASGKIRFLCSISTCQSRVARQAEYYCRRHQLEFQNPNPPEESIVPINNDPPVVTGTKKRKLHPSVNQPAVPTIKFVVAATTLSEDQWNDVMRFLHQFPSAQLSANLNVNNSTTHLLVDDSESQLHCTITKKIVQAAVRRHIFILSARWLTECIRVNQLVDEHPFEMISDSHTTLRLSVQNFQLTNQYIFSSTCPYLYAFAIECRQCQGSINRSELMELIQLTGAQLFHNEQAVDILIVLCDSNDKNLPKIKGKYAQAPASTIKFVTSDFLLKSIIKFEIQDLEKYAL